MHCHGTRNVLPQLLRNLRFHQSVLDQRIKQKVCQEFLLALQDGSCDISNYNFVVFARCKHNGVLYQTLSKNGTVIQGGNDVFAARG